MAHETLDQRGATRGPRWVERNTISTAPEPVATVGAQAPDVAPTAAQARKKATPSRKLPTSEPQAEVVRQVSKTEQAIALMNS